MNLPYDFFRKNYNFIIENLNLPTIHPTAIGKKNHPKSVKGGINISIKNVEQIRYEPPSAIISACRNKRICKSVMFACDNKQDFPRGFLKTDLRLKSLNLI
jgi:hypothetical protein